MRHPPEHINNMICEQTGASSAEPKEIVQSLWSGYGDIVRYRLSDCPQSSVIVKHIHPPTEQNHPRGWNTSHSHQRKLHSYQVEQHWYQHYAASCDNACRVPQCFGINTDANRTLLILEDLDAAGYPQRRSALQAGELESCLHWLAHFHARFIGTSPDGLWSTGSYWHLATRPDEWQAMAEGPLKQAAGKIDAALNNATYTTLIHGDAKVANFCFSEEGQQVAAVDFQYVGGGCGMKDVAYFMGSCLAAQQCEAQQAYCLDFYFSTLEAALSEINPDINFTALQQEWRELFPVAWADFTRFMLGWMPTHQKINHFSEKMTAQALAIINPL